MILPVVDCALADFRPRKFVPQKEAPMEKEQESLVRCSPATAEEMMTSFTKTFFDE